VGCSRECDPDRTNGCPDPRNTGGVLQYICCRDSGARSGMIAQSPARCERLACAERRGAAPPRPECARPLRPCSSGATGDRGHRGKQGNDIRVRGRSPRPAPSRHSQRFRFRNFSAQASSARFPRLPVSAANPTTIRPPFPSPGWQNVALGSRRIVSGFLTAA